MRLRDLTGQDHATAVLRRAVASGHVPHAYLFEGPDGVGKRAAAYGLALALTCAVEPGDGLRHLRVVPPHRGRPASGRAGIRGRDRPDRHRAGSGDRRDGGDAAARGAGARDHHRRRRPPERQRRQLPAQDAGGAGAPATTSCWCTSAPDRILPTIRSRVQRDALPRAARRGAGRAAHRRARASRRARAAVAAALADGSVARTLRAAGAEDDAIWESVTALREAAVGGAGGGAGARLPGTSAPVASSTPRRRSPATRRTSRRCRRSSSLLGAPLPRRDGDRGRRARAGAVSRAAPRELAAAGRAARWCARWRRSSRPTRRWPPT